MTRLLSRIFPLVPLTVLLTVLAAAQTPFWSASNGPYGGIVDYLAVHPNGSIFAAARSNGIFRSTNAGVSWQDVSAGLQEVTVWTFAIHQNGNIFAGSDGGGVYRSTNFGSSWNKLPGMNGLAVLSLAIDTTGIVYAGTVGNGIWTSIDSGASWQVLPGPFSNKFVYALAVDNGSDTTSNGTLYAGILGVGQGEFGIYRSSDRGISWRADSNTVSTNILSLHVDKSGVVYAGTQSSGILRFSKPFNAWEAYNLGMTTGSVYFVTTGPGGELYAGTNAGGVFRRKPGEPWQQINAGLENRYILSLAFSQEGTIIAGTGGAGIYQTSLQTISWNPTNNGFSSLDRPVLHKTSQGHLYTGTYRGGLYRSTDQGETWVSVHPLFMNHGILSVASGPQGQLYVGIVESPSVYRSVDGGLNWTPLKDGFADSSTYAIEVSPSGVVFAASTIGLYRLDPQADQWVAYDAFRLSIINDILAIDTTTILFAAENGIFRSSNSGSTWTIQAQGAQELYVKDLVSLPNGFLAAAFDQRGVYLSQDSGKTWVQKISGLTNLRARSLAANGQGELYLGTSGGGVFRSSYDASFWSVLNSGIGSLDIRSMTASPNNTIFAGTFRSGLYRGAAAVVRIENSDGGTPKEFSLSQNFPNPFNPSTTIRFELPEPGFVNLKVFDGLGREVATLLNGETPAGTHQVTLDLLSSRLFHLSTGIYYYRLTAGSFSQTRRMILLK